MKIKSPYKLIEVVFQRTYPGYVYRRELVDVSAMCGTDMEIVACYAAETGQYMGDAKMARFLCIKRGIRQIQLASKHHTCCSIGFHEKEQKWYGWSHRAICGFGIGDRIFQERFGTDKTPLTQHGKKPVLNMADAKVAAIKFARSVS